MQDGETAWHELADGVPLDPTKSEAYRDIALNQWIPSPRAANDHVFSILSSLATALRANHGDYWLTDFLHAKTSGKANQLLAKAREDNIEGKYKQAIQEASEAQRFYQQIRNSPGVAQAQIELIYAYRREQNAGQCLATISKLDTLIKRHRYAALEVQADFEHANCLGVKGRFDESWHFIDSAIHRAQVARYPSLQLRTLSLESSLYSGIGQLEQAWLIDLQGLGKFWEGVYPPERGFQFYSDLALTAEQNGWWCSAASLEREALSFLELTARTDFKVLGHLNLANDLRRCGQLHNARKELNLTTTLLGNLKEKRIAAILTTIAIAAIDTEEGRLDSATSELQKIDPDIRDVDNFEVKLLFFKTQAHLQQRLGRPAGEEKFLLEEAEIAWKGFSHLGSEHDRWAWYNEVDETYHRLTEIRLAGDGDARLALAEWEQYRAALVESAGGHFRQDNSKKLAWLDSRLGDFRTSTLVSFVVFPDRLDIWVADWQRVEHVMLEIDPKALQEEAGAFVLLCSDKNSLEEKVKNAGSRLYDRLLAPIERFLSPDRLLVIEADGFLSQIPWAALVTRTGAYTGELYMLASTPALLQRNSKIQRGGKGYDALIAYPGAVEFEGTLYPPLPHAQEEAEYVHKLYPGSRYLKGKDTGANDLLRLLSRASLFHFAGHAASRSRHGELLVQGADGAISAGTLRNLRLSHTDLVVLSACSTATSAKEAARDPNGLVEAFLAAGAKEVIATHWQLDSNGSFDFMQTFYNTLKQKTNSALALRESRREAIRHDKTKRPFFWGAFELFGSANSLTLN